MSTEVLFMLIAGGAGLVIGGLAKSGFGLSNLRKLFRTREKEADLVALEESIDEVEREQPKLRRTTEQKIDEIEKRRAEKKASLEKASDRELVERLSRALERSRRDAQRRQGSSITSDVKP